MKMLAIGSCRNSIGVVGSVGSSSKIVSSSTEDVESSDLYWKLRLSSSSSEGKSLENW